MTGLRLLLRKELLESWRTLRLPVVAVLFLFVGLVSPVLARFLPEIIEAVAGDELGGIPIPTPTAADAVAQLVKNLSQFGAPAAVLLAMGLVAGEKDRGTAAFLLAKPVTREAFLAAKLVGLGLVLALGVAIAVPAAWVYTAILFQPLPVGGWLALALISWLVLFAYGAVTFLGSVVTGSTIAAGGLGLGVLLVLSIAGAIPNLGTATPAGLLGPATALAAGTTSIEALGGDLVAGLVGTVVLGTAAIGASVVSFRRQEL